MTANIAGSELITVGIENIGLRHGNDTMTEYKRVKTPTAPQEKATR
jgi:hypothetical protein